jgi:hypothetical protein
LLVSSTFAEAYVVRIIPVLSPGLSVTFQPLTVFYPALAGTPYFNFEAVF